MTGSTLVRRGPSSVRFCKSFKHSVNLSDVYITLAKLMVSHDWPCSMVTNQIAFDQQDSHSSREFGRTMDRHFQVLWFPNRKPQIQPFLKRLPHSTLILHHVTVSEHKKMQLGPVIVIEIERTKKFYSQIECMLLRSKKSLGTS